MKLEKSKTYINVIKFFFVNFLLVTACVSNADVPSKDGDMLILAIENNDEVKIDKLLKQGVNANSRGFKYPSTSPLMIAVKQGNKNIVESLIKYKADVKQKGIVSFSLDNIEILNLLITHGADVNDNTVNWHSPIHNAISSERLSSAELLIKNNADINDQNNRSRRTPLQNAAQYGNELSVKWLLEHGADVNLVDSIGKTAITIGASYKANTKILKMLMDYGASLPPQKDILSITHGACRAGNLESLEFLSQNQLNIDFDTCYVALANISSPSYDILEWLNSRTKIKNITVGKDSLLHIAIDNNNLEIVELLIKSGVDVNLKDSADKPAFARAIWNFSEPTKTADFRDMIKLLAENGAHLNIKYGPQKTTALHELIASKKCTHETLCQTLIETIKLLLTLGLDVNTFNINTDTPLHFAAMSNNISLIEVLINYGADLKFTNSAMQTPLMLAIARESPSEILDSKIATIKMLVNYEIKSGSPPDWIELKKIANKLSSSKEKKVILALLEELEK